MKITLTLVAALSLLPVATPSPAAAEENAPAVTRPYAYSGACSSQGLWTAEALQVTEQIRNFATQLKSDPACQALGSRVQAALSGLADKVKPQAGEKYAHRLSELPQEISALREFMTSDSAFRTNVMNTMMNKSIEQATLSASTINNSAATTAANVVTDLVAPDAAALMSLGNRFAESSKQGLALFNEVVDALPQMQTCLTGNGAVSGQILATSVKLLTSFAASSQDDTGTMMATALSKLTTVMRDMRFAKVLRTLNEADFLASTSCLIEMSSENYCTTRDSKILFDEMIAKLQTRPREDEEKRVGLANPLAGYYILTQNLPMITDWVQRVQIGVDPRVPTDAEFQNKIFDEVNNFYKKLKSLQGNMSKDIEAMKAMPDLKGKQNAVRVLIKKVSLIVSGGSDDPNDDATNNLVNFFQMNGSAREIPFALMGIPIPAEVLGRGGTALQDPYTWIDNNYMNLPIFNDPDALVVQVKKNLDVMIQAANKNAIAYYNKWFIVDKISLVNESLLGLNYNVKDSLQLVSDYLGEVEKRIRATSNDLSMIGGIQETRTKIRNVMNAYKALQDLSSSLPPDSSTLTIEQRRQILEANVAIITAVYDEFDVLLGKSGWFANRIVKFVYQDYVNMLRQRHDFGQTVEDLSYATGLSIFDRIVATSGGNPAKVENDLSTALRINKMNIEATEQLIHSYFANETAELQAVVKISEHGASMKEKTIRISGVGRAYQDYLTPLPGENTNQAVRTGRALASATWELLKKAIPYFDIADPRYSFKNRRFAMDDEFGSAERLYEQFCIQSLAFSDVRSFYKLCKGVVLRSPFSDNFLATLNDGQRQELSVSYNDKLTESRNNGPLNLSQRICAFRDYNRKNLVMYLTSAQGR